MNLISSLTSLSHTLLFTFIGLLGISLVVAFHEFGHFLFCKIFNVKTPSFSIGFGPRLITKKIGETEFAISAIPLGGYVEIAGATEVGQGEQKEAYSRDNRSFASKPWYQKFLIMIAGILFNLIFAYTAISLMFMTGMPKTLILYPKNAVPVIETVLQGSPAEKAGLQAQDTITAINGQTINNQQGQQLIETIQANPGKEVIFTVNRNNQEVQIPVTLEAKDCLGTIIGAAGIRLSIMSLPGASFFDAIKQGIATTNKIIRDTVMSLRYLCKSGDTSMAQGPVKIVAGLAHGAKEGLKTFILFLAVISLSLAILNLLPLPILDGGQIVFYTIEAIAGRSIPDRVREYIHIGCWIAFMLLVVYLTYNDVRDLIRGYLSK